jgi:hypothetical protein
MLIHIGSCRHSVLLTMGDDSEEFMFVADINLGDVFDEAALLLVFSYF